MTAVPRASTVPDVCDALMAAFAAIDDADLEVQDGPKPKASKRKVIAVGVGDPAVVRTVTRDMRAGGWIYDESYDVVCILWSWGGKTTEQATHRSNCGAMLAQVRAAVDALRVDGVTISMGAEGDWTQSYSGEGQACSIPFSVHAVASI